MCILKQCSVSASHKLKERKTNKKSYKNMKTLKFMEHI